MGESISACWTVALLYAWMNFERLSPIALVAGGGLAPKPVPVIGSAIERGGPATKDPAWSIYFSAFNYSSIAGTAARLRLAGVSTSAGYLGHEGSVLPARREDPQTWQSKARAALTTWAKTNLACELPLKDYISTQPGGPCGDRANLTRRQSLACSRPMPGQSIRRVAVIARIAELGSQGSAQRIEPRDCGQWSDGLNANIVGNDDEVD